MFEHKPRLLTFLLSIILTICIAIPILTEPLTVYADKNAHHIGGEGSGSGTGYGKGSIGAGSANTAFFMYIVLSDSGGAVTPGIIVLNPNGGIYRKRDKIVDWRYITKQPGGVYSNFAPVDINEYLSMTFTDVNAPYPVLSDGGRWKPNGNAVKEYLMHELKNHPLGFKYTFEYILWYTMAQQYPEAYERVLEHLEANDYSIVIQPVAMMHPESPNKEMSMTLDGWIQYFGDGYSHTFVTGGLYNCMVLDQTRFGLAVPSDTSSVHVSNYTQLMKTGWGIHIIEMGVSNSQTTCDETLDPSPHAAPNESIGKYKIVKSYRIKNTSSGTYTDMGTFTKEEVCPDIEIEDETEYKLVAWKTSTTYKPDIKSTQWESTVPPVQKQTV